METYTIHPLANLIPAMAPEDFDQLVEGIRTNGLIEPIVLHEGKILDGRHRYKACQQVDVVPRFEPYTGNDPLAFVIAKNLHRRHLSATQKAMLAAELLPLLEAQARERQQLAGGDHGNQYTGSKVAVTQKIGEAANQEKSSQTTCGPVHDSLTPYEADADGVPSEKHTAIVARVLEADRA